MQSINYYCQLTAFASTSVDSMTQDMLINTATHALELRVALLDIDADTNPSVVRSIKAKTVCGITNPDQLLQLAHGCLAKANCL